ncbi:MAG TPA: hypothetical protein VKI18_11160 [Albitalea sp.]|nr:hypothetical protein [Albitalea sp.]
MPSEATSAEARDPSHRAGEPSFFPVLREEIDGKDSAANDDASADLAGVLRQRTADRRHTLTLAVASLGLCAMLLGWYLLAPPPSVDSARAVPPAATRVAPASDEVVKVQTAYTQPVPAQPDKAVTTVAAPTVAAPTVTAPTVDAVQSLAIAPVSAPPRAAAPQRAVRRPAANANPRGSMKTRGVDRAAPPATPCSAEIVALGLCDAVAR